MMTSWRDTSSDRWQVICSKIQRWAPLFEWLPKYNWRRDFVYDLIAGLTYSTVVIPQSMAYAMLAKLPPVYGLYSSITPMFLYFIFGTSRHLVTGTFALTSMMLGEAVANVLQKSGTPREDDYEKEFIITTLRITFLVGMLQILFSFLNVGRYISKYLLPDSLISGFTNAAAIYITTSQLPGLLQFQVPEYFGVFNLVKSWGYMISHLHEAHLPTFLLGSGVIVSILLLKSYETNIQQWIQRSRSEEVVAEDEVPLMDDIDTHFALPRVANNKANSGIKLPIPETLLVIIFYTAVTWFFSLEKHGISIIGFIPNGFPMTVNSVNFRDGSDFFNHLNQSILLAIVAYVMTMSIAKSFAKKSNYQIDENQEMFALGMSTAISSFFSGYISCGSLTRTSVVHSTGGKSQIAMLIGTTVVCFILLGFTFVFHYLPNVVLAGVTLMACKNLFLKLDEVVGYWRYHRYQFVIWFTTFTVSVIFKAELGIAAGMTISMIGLVIERFLKPYFYL